MTRAIVVASKIHAFWWRILQPILDFFLQQMKKYKDEFDRLYIVDSNWISIPSKAC